MKKIIKKHILALLGGLGMFTVVIAFLSLLWWGNPIELFQESFWFRCWTIFSAFCTIGASLGQVND